MARRPHLFANEVIFYVLAKFFALFFAGGR